MFLVLGSILLLRIRQVINMGLIITHSIILEQVNHSIIYLILRKLAIGK